MLTYEQALAAILEHCQTLNSEKISLTSSLRRVLAEPLKATFDLPQFNNSAVDGFGVLVEDLINCSESNPVKLEIVGEVAAGQNQMPAQLQRGQCIRILTGAPVPGTVEAIKMKEVCAEDGKFISVTESTRIGENIRLQGEEIEAGAVVLKAGELITPPVLGVIATLGITEFLAYRLPRVAVIATGDELIEPGQPLADGQIYNSNSYALVAALNAAGVTEVIRLHANDNKEETTRIFQQALEFADIVISAGGVSVGEYDFIKDVCEEQGVKTVFWRIAIKPGKPVYFGVKAAGENSSQKIILGLPGNPVSALVTFNLFARPAIARLQGRRPKTRVFLAKAARNLKKKAGRLDFVRGNLTATTHENSNMLGELLAMPTSGQESHMLTGLAKADCLMHFEQDLEFLPEGDKLKVQLLNWFD